MLRRLPDILVGRDKQQRHGHTDTTDGLGYGHHVRLDTCPLKGEEGTGTAAASLNVVDNQQDVVLVAELPAAPEELRGKGIDAALGLHRLHNQSSGLFHAGVVIVQQPLHIGHHVQLREHIRCGNMGAVLQAHAGSIPGVGLGGQGERTQGHAVEAAHEGPHIGAAGDFSCQLQARLHSVGARGATAHHPVVKSPGLEDFLLQGVQELPLCRGMQVQGVKHAVVLEIGNQLFLDIIIVVSVIQCTGAAEEIQIAVSFLVIHECTLCPVKHHREMATVGAHRRFIHFKGLGIHK